MKPVLPIAAAAALVTFSSAHAVTFYRSEAAFLAQVPAIVVETFENTGQTLDTPLSSFSHNGITFIGQAGTPSANVYLLPAGNSSDVGAGVPKPTTSTLLTANGDENILVRFDVGYTAVGFDVYLNGLGAAQVQAYNGGTLLDSYNFPSDENDLTYLGMVSDTPITDFVFVSTRGRLINTGIDNIAVLTTVPEPAMLSVLGLGGLALGLARRRAARLA